MNLLLDTQPKNRLLKKTAVPSVNLATDTPITLEKNKIILFELKEQKIEPKRNFT